jgi:hypothetical protein
VRTTGVGRTCSGFVMAKSLNTAHMHRGQRCATGCTPRMAALFLKTAQMFQLKCPLGTGLRAQLRPRLTAYSARTRAVRIAGLAGGSQRAMA